MTLLCELGVLGKGFSSFEEQKHHVDLYTDQIMCYAKKELEILCQFTLL